MKKLSLYNDDKLIELLKSDDVKSSEAAFQEIYQRYSPMINAYLYKILNDEQLTEDFFQDTFIKFYINIKKDTFKTNIAGYLIKIARNLCLNYKRDKKSKVSIEDLNISIEKNQNYENQELLELINYALDLLDFDYKEAFILREYDGFSYQEIANITGTTLTNAKSRVFRAKKRIKEILQPYVQEFLKLE